MMGVKVLGTSGGSHHPRRNGKKSLTHWKNWMLAEDKKETLVKSRKESSKRVSEVLVMAEELASVGTTDEHTRAMTKRRMGTIPRNRRRKRGCNSWKKCTTGTGNWRTRYEERCRVTFSLGSRKREDQGP